MDIEIAMQSLMEQFILFVPKLIVAIIIFLASLYIAGLATRAITRAMEKREVDSEINLLVSRVVRWAIVIVGLIWALNQVDFNVTGFVAGLGIVGFTVGFALKDVTTNFVAGILLLIQQPFDIGNAIEVKGYGGVVVDIEIRATTLRTWDGLMVIIPNADVYSSPITNFSRATKRRIELNVGVGYETDLQKASEVMMEVIQSLAGVLDDPAPSVVFKTFGDSSINATLYFWIDTSATGYLPTMDASVKEIKRALERENINIPFPIRTVRMEQTQDKEAT